MFSSLLKEYTTDDDYTAANEDDYLIKIHLITGRTFDRVVVDSMADPGLVRVHDLQNKGRRIDIALSSIVAIEHCYDG